MLLSLSLSLPSSVFPARLKSVKVYADAAIRVDTSENYTLSKRVLERAERKSKFDVKVDSRESLTLFALTRRKKKRRVRGAFNARAIY